MTVASDAGEPAAAAASTCCWSGPATSSASIRRWSSAPSRGLDHRLRAELPRRTSSSTTRTSPGATRPRSRHGEHGCMPWITLLVLDEGRVRAADAPGGRCRRSSSRRPPRSPTSSRRRPAVGVGARSRQRRARTGTRAESRRAGAGCCAATPTRLLRLDVARDGSSRTRGYHAVRDPDVRGRPPGRARASRSPDADTGLDIAWATAANFPIYYEWYFRTGAAGDFEELVTALKPRDDRRARRHPRHGHPAARLSGCRRPPARRTTSSASKASLLAPTAEPKPLDRGQQLPPRSRRSRSTCAADAQRRRSRDAATIRSSARRSTDAGTRSSSAIDAVAGEPQLDQRAEHRSRATGPSAGMGTQVIQTATRKSYMKLAWQQIGDVLAAEPQDPRSCRWR